MKFCQPRLDRGIVKFKNYVWTETNAGKTSLR